MTAQTLTITTRINARRKLVWYIVGREDKTYPTERQARSAAAGIARFERVAAVFPQARQRELGRTCVISPFSDAFPLRRAAEERGIDLPRFEVVVVPAP